MSTNSTVNTSTTKSKHRIPVSAQDGYLYADDDKPNYIEEVYYMRWYKIEFFTHGTLPENRIKVVERQYSTQRRALAAADAMQRNMDKHGIECWSYSIKPL